MTLVTCSTDGCGNAGVAIDVALTTLDENGDPQPVDAVICGACGKQITDIKEADMTENRPEPSTDPDAEPTPTETPDEPDTETEADEG